LGKLGQTVSCAHEAILADRSPAVLVNVQADAQRILDAEHHLEWSALGHKIP
jgi:hypothetical protein